MGLTPVPAAAYSDLELDGTLRSLPVWWDMVVTGLDPGLVEPVRQQQESLLGGPLPDAVAALRAGIATGAITREAVERTVDGSLGLLREAGRALAAAGAFRAASGSVHGLFRSNGGVPKHPVDDATIDQRGVVGDRQAARQHHGRPWQALCLWSTEVVERLRGEGHPIRPGAAGENVSITGIDWALVRPGVVLQLGDDVVAEVSTYSPPCTKNAQWFVDGDFGRMSHDRELGISRVYASVLHGGTLRAGDPVVVEP